MFPRIYDNLLRNVDSALQDAFHIQRRSDRKLPRIVRILRESRFAWRRGNVRNSQHTHCRVGRTPPFPHSRFVPRCLRTVFAQFDTVCASIDASIEDIFSHADFEALATL